MLSSSLNAVGVSCRMLLTYFRLITFLLAVLAKTVAWNTSTCTISPLGNGQDDTDQARIYLLATAEF